MSATPPGTVTTPHYLQPPRAAYVHIPFCRHRCGYCNFTVVAGRDDLIDTYLDCLQRELEPLGEPQPVDTLFFGGGTPSHLSPAQLEALFTRVTRWFVPQANAEISLEANPLDLTADRLAVLARHGVNRLSLGAQSFHAPTLQLLERDHSPTEVRDAIAAASQVIPNVSLDLIFAVPGQTVALWQADLEAALAAQPQHLSTYGLTFEKGTQFWNRLSHHQLEETDEELQRDLYALAIDTLTAAGFEHYEVSNFARPGYRSRHNQVYWTGAGYHAIGAGASRYVRGVRSTNHRSTTTYCKRVLAGESPIAEQEEPSAEERARERAVFGLRRLEGLTRTQFAAETGYDFDQLLGVPLRKFVGLGMLSDDGERIQLTRAGLFVSDGLWPHFLTS